MKVSVIVPTYKPGTYLWECLRALENQTLAKDAFEVILVQNGCAEPYSSQIKDFIQTQLNGLNIRHLELEQGGVSNARNTGIDQAQGEYIAFIDDDDYVSETYLEELLNAASPQVVSLSNTFSFIDDEEHVYTPFRITKNFEGCTSKGHTSINKAKKYFSGPCMKLIHRDIIGDRRFDLRFKNGEDSIYMFLLSDRISEVAFTSPEAVYYRRFRAGSAVTSSSTFMQRAENARLRIKEYNSMYFGSFPRYNTLFYITRLIATIKGVLLPQ